MARWKMYLVIDKEASIDDLKRMCANKLKKEYDIVDDRHRGFSGYNTLKVYVSDEEDAVSVQEMFDVIDKKWLT